jgi:serine/threonine protein kinase
MELCEFGSLADVMKIRSKAFSEPQVAYIMRRTLRALEYLASSNKVHRDIKPANIMLCGNGKIKLGDLGITKELKPDGTLRDRIGSVLYLAPEIARDTPYNAKVDVWSLGITAVELLLGRAPRSSERTKEILKQLVTEPSGPAIQLPHASPELIAFLNRVLQVDPNMRPTAAELLEDPFIMKASSTSFMGIISELQSRVSAAGGFQSALSSVSNGRIEPASPSTSTSFANSDSEDAVSDQTYDTGTDSQASSPGGSAHNNIHNPSPLLAIESVFEIHSLISRPILDSPSCMRTGTEYHYQQAILH